MCRFIANQPTWLYCYNWRVALSFDLELKLEMQNRQMADREIYGALQKYQIIIQEQVEKQRSEIKTSKKPLVPPRSPSRTD